MKPSADMVDDARGRTVDPESKAVLDMIVASGRPPIHELELSVAREGMQASRLLLGTVPPDTIVQDLIAPGPGGDIPIRLYRAREQPLDLPIPLLVFFHGGGWVLGDIQSGDAFCASVAQRLGMAVAAVDYRLAPEHVFPAAVEDSFAALDWLVDNAAALRLQGDRVAVAGDSAGGTLAAVCALRARDCGKLSLKAQILLYPVTDLGMATESYRQNATGYMLTAESMRWFRDQYLGEADAADWRASPLRAERFAGLAPALIVTCGFDPLQDEGQAYAQRLVEAGVSTRFLPYPRQLHGFAMWGRAVSDAETLLRQVVEELRFRLF
jgi:acetyl esterase